jgi:hypothetical protein
MDVELTERENGALREQLDPGCKKRGPEAALLSRSKTLDPVSTAIHGLHGIITSCNYLPIFTSDTSKISAAFGGIGPFGCEP